MDGVILAKVCTACHQLRHLDEYSRGDGRYGRNSQCRDCRRAAQRLYKRGHRNPNISIWTPELTARLHDMHAYGMWPKEIAPVLGLTRNTVIGKLNREGLVTLRPTKPKIEKPTSTTESRLDALEATMKAALAIPVGRIPPRKDIPPARIRLW